MNETTVRALAQSNPVPNMTSAWTSNVEHARTSIENLTVLLRHIDKIATVLKERHDIVLAADLGPIGNAAAAARRDLEKQQPAGFTMPKPS